MLIFGAGHHLVRHDGGIAAQATHQLQGPLARGREPGLQQIAHHQGAGIDEGVAGNAVLELELHQGVEWLAGGLLAHPGPDLLLLIEGERQGQAQGLGDALDGEGLAGVTGGEQLPLHGADSDPESVRRHLRQRGNVIGHLALPEQRAHLFQDAGQ
ncbi:hypothetical protein D3C84_959100 [compost metagenome]